MVKVRLFLSGQDYRRKTVFIYGFLLLVIFYAISVLDIMFLDGITYMSVLLLMLMCHIYLAKGSNGSHQKKAKQKTGVQPYSIYTNARWV